MHEEAKAMDDKLPNWNKLNSFVEEKKLSAEKIAKLKAILDKSGTENQEDQ